jgi:NTE family protein
LARAALWGGGRVGSAFDLSIELASSETIARACLGGIRSDISDFAARGGTLPCPHRTPALAQTKTRLAKMDGTLQERLINWGYAIADAVMRAWVISDAPKPEIPYTVGVG